MSKHNKIDVIEFRAQSKKQLKQLTKFYNEVFAWDYKDWGEEYSDTQDSGLTSGVDLAKDTSKNLTLTVVYSEDLNSSKNTIVAAGGTITQDIYTFPGGRRFHFTDPAGNELAIWSE